MRIFSCALLFLVNSMSFCMQRTSFCDYLLTHIFCGPSDANKKHFGKDYIKNCKNMRMGNTAAHNTLFIQQIQQTTRATVRNRYNLPV